PGPLALRDERRIRRCGRCQRERRGERQSSCASQSTHPLLHCALLVSVFVVAVPLPVLALPLLVARLCALQSVGGLGFGGIRAHPFDPVADQTALYPTSCQVVVVRLTRIELVLLRHGLTCPSQIGRASCRKDIMLY